MEKYQGKEYWKNYMEKWWGAELIEKSNIIEEQWIKSSRQDIHIEIYDTKKNAPTIVFLHGLVGHSRIALPFTMPLYELGYNIVAPDLKGYCRV